MATNGPAIWGGCVTWRSHPATYPGALVEKLSRWQDRYGAVFANPGTEFWEDYALQGTEFKASSVKVLVQQFLLKVRVVGLCHGIRILKLRHCVKIRKNCDEQLTHIVRVMRSIF